MAELKKVESEEKKISKDTSIKKHKYVGPRSTKKIVPILDLTVKIITNHRFCYTG